MVICISLLSCKRILPFLSAVVAAFQNGDLMKNMKTSITDAAKRQPYAYNFSSEFTPRVTAAKIREKCSPSKEGSSLATLLEIERNVERSRKLVVAAVKWMHEQVSSAVCEVFVQYWSFFKHVTRRTN